MKDLEEKNILFPVDIQIYANLFHASKPVSIVLLKGIILILVLSLHTQNF